LSASLAHEAVTGFSDGAKAQAAGMSAYARVQAGQQVADASAQGAQSQASPGSVPSASPDTQNPADLLARMLLRAANVDARVNANAVSDAALSARGSGAQTTAAVRAVNGGHGEGVGFQPMTASARLDAALGDIVAASAQARNDSSSSDGESSFRDASSPSNAPVASVKATAASDASAFGAPFAAPTSFHAQIASANGALGSTPVDPSAIIEQVVKGMSMRTQSDGTSEVRMRLSPDNLGAVTLKLTVDGSNVSATALAQNSDVRNALVAHQHQLARSLADAGLKLTGFTVNLSGGDAGNDRNNRDRTSGFGRHYAIHEVTAAGQTDSTDSSAAGPSIVPESTLALFSYLA
jgi:flagellar hook-length control protein FliK